MLFYVLIAFIALNVFTQEGVMAEKCEDKMMNNFCEIQYKKYCNDDILGEQNDATLIQENENKNLVEILRDFQGRQECNTCHGSGYTVCSYCRGGKKAKETFRVRLRCARCDRNGIAPCKTCANPSL